MNQSIKKFKLTDFVQIFRKCCSNRDQDRDKDREIKSWKEGQNRLVEKDRLKKIGETQ